MELIPIFRVLLENMYEREECQYTHRSGIGFFIQYFEEYCDKLTIPEIQQMIDWDDADTKKERGGFAEWLIGTSYTTRGNLQYHRKDIPYESFTRKPER